MYTNPEMLRHVLEEFSEIERVRFHSGKDLATLEIFHLILQKYLCLSWIHKRHTSQVKSIPSSLDDIRDNKHEFNLAPFFLLVESN